MSVCALYVQEKEASNRVPNFPPINYMMSEPSWAMAVGRTACSPSRRDRPASSRQPAHHQQRAQEAPWRTTLRAGPETRKQQTETPARVWGGTETRDASGRRPESREACKVSSAPTK